jgi:hypothetical protein
MGLVDQNIASWNQAMRWLTQVEALREPLSGAAVLS